MSLRRAFHLEGSEISLVQNRLNVAALGLTVLVFSGSFTLSLFGSLRHAAGADFRLEFLHILVPLALGIVVSLGAIACFLQSQHSEQYEEEADVDAEKDQPPRPRWYNTRQWWFCLGQLLLYMALAEALSASLTEVVYGISLSREGLGFALGVLALPVWWAFLFAGPVMFLRRMSPFQSHAERVALRSAYVVVVVTLLSISAEGYEVRGGGAFLQNVLEQLYHPMTWHTSWDD